MLNNRPMSVLPVMAKLLANLVTNQLYQYMNDNGYFSPRQLGTFHLYSTVLSIAKSTDDWHNEMDLGELTVVVFIDLKRFLTQSTVKFFGKSWCKLASKVGN